MRKKKKEKNQITMKHEIVMIAAVILLCIILITVSQLLPHTEKKKMNDDDDMDSSQIIYQSNEGAYLYLNKYIYEFNNKIIKNLDGKKIMDKIEGKVDFYPGKDEDYIVIRRQEDNDKETGMGSFIVKKVVDDKVKNLYNKRYQGEKGNGLLQVSIIENYNDHTLLGISEKDGSIIYLLENNKFKKIDLPDISIYQFTDTMTSSKYVYDANSFISVSNKDNTKYGIYDIEKNKESVKPIYDKIFYAKENQYIAIKEGKAGLINRVGDILLEFKYKSLFYVSSNYMAIKDNNTLVLLDSKFNEINSSSIELKEDYEIKTLYDKILVKNGEKIYYLDKNNEFKYLTPDVKSFSVIKDTLLVHNRWDYILIFNEELEYTGIFYLKDGSEIIGVQSGVVVLKNKDNTNSYIKMDTGKEFKELLDFIKKIEDYDITYNIESGSIKVIKEEKEIGVLENASLNAFIQPNSGGIDTDDKIIFYANDKDHPNIIIVNK